YDRHRMEPLFQLEIGSPGSSFAIEIAKKIGLPAEIIESATRKVGAEHIDYDKNLQDAARDKRYWENKREQIRIKEKKTDEALAQLQKQLEGINAERKEILRRAKEEAKELLSQTNATIENTIREIKEAHAEKERTREIRREFNEQQKELKKEDTETIRIKGIRTSSAHQKAETESFAVGDYVKYGSSIGQVIEVKGKKLIIAIGQMEATVDAGKVEKSSRKLFKESIKGTSTYISKETADNIRQRKLNFKSDIDVRGMRAQEAVETIAYFIDDAIIVGASQVRILHGTGTGALKQYIREYLDTISMVRTYHDEHIQLGGAGITIVEFR
ncbi:MAG: Smr/MutS family protein, partial [Paludibacteraceae bacterium]|nr:Smr/MutS family protein [Paludibacteraceae bacterium]